MQKINDRLLNWASDIDTNTVLQAERTARLPIVEGHVALMPDAHLGTGATVGSVIPTKGAIIPAAVGVDIGCGMVATETNLLGTDLPDNFDKFLKIVEKTVPAGMGEGHHRAGRVAENWMKANRPQSDLDSTQERNALKQFGSLGGGNHFVEVCLDEREVVWIVLHSGSRGIGNKLAQAHIKKAKKVCKDLQLTLEDPDLAYFVQNTPEFDHYIADMLWAQDYAMANRQAMIDNLLPEFFKFVGKGKVIKTINCHHNFTQREFFCLTCQGNNNPGNGNLEAALRKDGTLSKVLSFLGDCQIGFHSCGEPVLFSSQDDRELPPSLVSALVRILCDLPEGDQSAVAEHIRLLRSGLLCSCHETLHSSTTTYVHSLASTSSEIAPLCLLALESLPDTPDTSQVLSFLGIRVDLPSQSHRQVSCGDSVEAANRGHDGQELWITRKGAIQADVGDLGVIPGSMGTKSYIVEGLGNPLSWNSCSHGAGRRMSRGQAKRDFTVDDLAKQMVGKIWLEDRAQSLLDEIPSSYKDIDAVMADQKDLVSIQHELHQVLNFKGA